MNIKNPITKTSGIEELNLPTRAYNRLRREGITTVGALTEKCFCELMDIHNMGWKSVEAIVDSVRANGFNLNECNSFRNK